jgi:hypothetical protein
MMRSRESRTGADCLSLGWRRHSTRDHRGQSSGCDRGGLIQRPAANPKQPPVGNDAPAVAGGARSA